MHNERMIKLDIDVTKLHDTNYLHKQNLISHKKDDFTLLHYNKQALNHSNYHTLGLFRSVIFYKNELVCFSPPKSLPLDEFKKKMYDNYVIWLEEFVEGTMINMFYANNEWHIATKTQIGGNNTFYTKSKTFKGMFVEAMIEESLTFEDFDKDFCYSFVLQHPSNEIVNKINKPSIKLCRVYKCHNLTVEEYLLPYSHEKLSRLCVDHDTNSGSVIPEKIIQYARDNYATNKTNYHTMGIIIRNNVSHTKIRNPNYEMVKKIKGNQPNIQYQYLYLRKCGQVGEYLKYYPDAKTEFAKYRNQVHNFTNMIYKNYVDVFIKKTTPIQNIDYEYRPHVVELHKKYINEYRELKIAIHFNLVKEYINNLPIPRLLFAINYKLRNKDRIELIENKNKQLKSI